jgi:hypothetical protein
MLLYGSYVVGASWLMFGLARMQAGWEKSQSRTATLRFALQTNARQLLQSLKTIEQLEVETQKMKATAGVSHKEQEKRKQEVMTAVPPPPDQIYITSEFPASQKDHPWVVEIGRDDKSAPRPAWDREPQPSLFWAATHQAASARGQQIAGEFKNCHMKGVRRFFDESAKHEKE